MVRRRRRRVCGQCGGTGRTSYSRKEVSPEHVHPGMTMEEVLRYERLTGRPIIADM